MNLHKFKLHKWVVIVSVLLTSQQAVAADAPDRSKKLDFDDQSINALDPDYGKLDLSSLRDDGSLPGRMYPIRKDYRKDQNQQIKYWGVGE